MDNSVHNYSSLILFNSRLFTINGAPLKFYLDGYSLSEFNNMVKIIEAYGGELSKPDAPSTFVFCEPGRPVGEGEFDRYDIQYFYDSIVALCPQKLINYKLQVFTKQDITSSMDDLKSTNLKIKEENNNESQESRNLANSLCYEETTNFYGEDSIDERFLSSEFQNDLTVSRTLCTAIRECFVKVERLDESKIQIAATHPQINDPFDDDSNASEEERCESQSEDDGDSDELGVSQTTDDSHDSQADDEFIPPSLRRSSIVGAKNTREKQKCTFTRAEKQKRKNLKENPIDENQLKRSPWTEEEHRIIIQYLIDKDLIHRPKSRAIWEECLKACRSVLKPTRTARKLQARFEKYLRKNYAKYTDNPEALRELKKAEGSNAKLPRVQWTEEEKQVLVQYIIDNDGIHRAKGLKVWTECLEACKSQLQPNRTARSLAGCFKSMLRYDYAKYTDNSEALEKFKRHGRTGKASKEMQLLCKFWTEEENRALIQYLIDKDAIHKARKYRFWRENLKEIESVLNIRRTAHAFRAQFSRKLSHDYAKYTDDPEALHKFKVVESLSK